MQNNNFSTLFVGQKIVKLTEVDSTNNYLKNLLSKDVPLDNGTVIMADKQFAGRGQQGNTWFSQPKKNITVSFYLKTHFIKVTNQFYLSMAISLAITDCLKELTGESFFIKWPNDIYFGNKKIVGILIENTIKGAYLKNSIIGIGLNVNQIDFENPNKTTSLALILGKEIDLFNVLACLSKFIEQRILKLEQNFESLKSEYLNQLFRFNQPAKFIVKDKIFIGKIINVSEFGELQIETNAIITNYNIKEISFVI